MFHSEMRVRCAPGYEERVLKQKRVDPLGQPFTILLESIYRCTACLGSYPLSLKALLAFLHVSLE